MERRLRLGILLALLCAGCPQTPAKSVPAPTPSPTASASPATIPAAVPQPSGTAPRAAPTESTRPLTAEVIPLATQAHPWPGVTLGLERVETLPRLDRGTRREEQAGHLTLGLGQVFFSSDVFVGDRLHLGGAVLEILGLKPSALRFRWLRSPAAGEVPKVQPARPRLRELGLYRFSDDRILGVGKVSSLAKRDGSSVKVVTLSLFPPGYEQNPLQDYEVLPRLVVGKALGAGTLGGRKLRLSALQPARGESPGWIGLAE